MLAKVKRTADEALDSAFASNHVELILKKILNELKSVNKNLAIIGQVMIKQMEVPNTPDKQKGKQNVVRSKKV